MKYEWKKSAKNELAQAIRYCAKVFGNRVAEKFIDSVDHQVSLLGNNPSMGMRAPDLDTPRRQYRTLLVHKHFELVYHVDEKKQILYIVSLWDVRREPAKLIRRIHRKNT